MWAVDRFSVVVRCHIESFSLAVLGLLMAFISTLPGGVVPETIEMKSVVCISRSSSSSWDHSGVYLGRFLRWNSWDVLQPQLFSLYHRSGTHSLSRRVIGMPGE